LKLDAMLDSLHLVSHPRPWGGASDPQNKQKVRIWELLRPRDVKNADRSDYVYENKGKHDKMSTEIAEILHKFMYVLQKIAHLQRQFAGICGFTGWTASPLPSMCTVIGGLE
jgi:hypothetical protein